MKQLFIRFKKKILSSWVFSIVDLLLINSGHQLAEAVRLGSDYGGWWVPESLSDMNSKDSVFISAGVGEDISFDLAMVSHFRLSGILIDPTQRSLSYIKSTLGKYRNLKESPIIHTESDLLEFELNADDNLTLSFINKAVWKDNDGVMLIPPDNPDHVSYRLRGEGRGEQFDTVSLSDLLSEYENVKLVKLDIEGSELEILATLVLENLERVDVLLVEFDFLRQPKVSDALRFLQIARKLRASGHFLLKREGLNLTLVRRKIR
jgi:FkbM family methyltransferase